MFSGQLLGSGLNLRCALDGALAGLVAISASEQQLPEIKHYAALTWLAHLQAAQCEGVRPTVDSTAVPML